MTDFSPEWFAAPLRLLVPNYSPLRRPPLPPHGYCHNARVAWEREQREAEEAAKVERDRRISDAVAGWEETRASVVDQPAAVAALDLHQPWDGCDRIECLECEDSDDDDRTTWPCDTYRAIVGTVDVG